METRGEKCSARSKCNNARECDYCARARQMQIAGIAERLEQQHGQLCLTVLKPEQNTAAAVKAVHASFMRRALAPAGIWTIETGTLFGGLHLNIISPQPKAASWKAQVYCELLNSTARQAAAYIAKRSGIPAKEQYAGRLFGSFGQIGAILASENMPPIVQGAAIEAALSGVTHRGVIADPAARQELTREQYRDIARQHLGNLRAYAKEE